MASATYVGVVENGKVKLSDGVELKENTQVYVVVPDFVPTTLRIASPRLANAQVAPLFVKQVVEIDPNA